MKILKTLIGLTILMTVSAANAGSVSFYSNGQTTDAIKIQKCTDGEYAVSTDINTLKDEAKSTDPCSSLSHDTVSKGKIGKLRLERVLSSSQVDVLTLAGAGINIFTITIKEPNSSDKLALDEIRKCALMIKNGATVKELRIAYDSAWSLVCEFE